MRRFALVCGALTLTVATTWAVAAPQSSPSPVQVHADPVVANTPTAPEVTVPQVATPEVSTAPAPPAHGPTPDTADHLVAEPVVEEPPTVLVTTVPPTTVAPAPTTVPPTTVPPTTVPPAPTTTAPVVTVAFHATQAYGSCEEPVPYDVFSGTATPGSTVTISSPYGSGSTTADAAGHWERKVEFPAAPRNQTFSVTATGRGGSHTLQFTATGGAGHA